MTGRQTDHHILRLKVIEHMKTIEVYLLPHMKCSLENYLQKSQMRRSGTWGTDIEIFAAASLVSTDIFVYRNVDNAYRWQLFSKKMLDGSLPENDSAIYIEHVNGVHYDVVLDIDLHTATGEKLDFSEKKNDDHPHLTFEKSVGTYSFVPITELLQQFLCSKVNLPLVIKCKTREIKILGPPLEKRSILGDGNCLFRALSYIVTGRQIYHNILRSKVIEQMTTIEVNLLPHMNCSSENYLQKSQLRNPGTWGTDIEIFAAASLLSTDLFVYTNVDNVYRWQLFSRKMLDGSLPENDSAIYIEHVNGVHYDVVLDVDVQTTTPRKCSEVKRKCSVDDIGEKPRNIKKPKLQVARNIEEECISAEMLEQNCVEKTLPLITKTQAEKNMSQFNGSMQFSIVQCIVCLEAWPLKTRQKSLLSYICSRCVRDKQNPKTFSLQNFITPSKVSNELQGLTQVEEMLIACVLPIMRVYVKPGGQRGYSGHCINLPQNVSEIADSLPRCPKQLPLIVMTMKGKENTFKDVIVRRAKVETALNWLTQNNPQYQNLKLNSKILNSLPECGVPSQLQTIETELQSDDREEEMDDSDIVYDSKDRDKQLPST